MVSGAKHNKTGSSLMQQLFADLRRDSGAVVIAAADAEGYAYESANGSHGIFTKSLLDALIPAKPGMRSPADLDGDGAVSKKSGGNQVPNVRRESPDYDFVFYRASPPAAKSAAKKPARVPSKPIRRRRRL